MNKSSFHVDTVTGRCPSFYAPPISFDHVTTSFPSKMEALMDFDAPPISSVQDTPSSSPFRTEASVAAVERILNYSFRDKRLLEEALTHSSYSESTSYQRLEFVGDAALGLALTNHVFLTYPKLDPGELSLIRAANISTEKLARVAIKHRLFQFVRHNAAGLEHKVREFAEVVSQEDDPVSYGGSMKAPKILADIVESIAAAVYVDVNFDLSKLWVMESLLPLVLLSKRKLQSLMQQGELCISWQDPCMLMSMHLELMGLTGLLRLKEQNRSCMSSVARKSGPSLFMNSRKMKAAHMRRSLFLRLKFQL
ncbi:hypothetical protein DITRI_Ditri01bG0184700 [Diplodiscus trichospermus]